MITEESRSVLETLAKSFTNRDELSIEWGLNPCTDFNKIYIRKEQTIVPGIECTPGELWLSQKAAAAHESAHLLFTSEEVWKNFCRGSLEAHILNIVEDARVEKAMANLFPGTLRWFRFSNEYIFVNRKDWTCLPPQDQALHELCAYAVVGRIHNELPEREKNFVQKCAPYIDQGRISATTEGAAKEAAKIVEIYKDYYGELPTLAEPIIAFSVKPASSPEGKLDPRRKPKLEPIVTEDVPEEPKIEPLPEEIDFEPTPDIPEESEGDTEKGEPEQEDIEGNNEPSCDEKFEPGHDEFDAEPGYDEDEINHDEFEAESGEAEPGGDTDEAKPGDEAGKTEPCYDESGDKPSEAEPCREGDGDIEIEPGEADCDESGEAEPSHDGEDNQDDELLSDMDELLKKSEKEVEKLSSSKSKPIEKPVEVTKKEVAEKFSMDNHGRRRLIYKNVIGNTYMRAEIEKSVHPTVIQTVNEVRKVLESRRGGKRRCIPKGHLDKSGLWKISVKEPNIFMKKNMPSTNPDDLAIYLLLDCSASMYSHTGYYNRLYYAVEAGIMLHMVCKMLNIPHAAVGFTTDGTKQDNVLHYKLKELNENEARIEAIYCEAKCSENVDGYSIRVAASELLNRPETNKVLFIVSDGMPVAKRGYHGKEAVDDTARAVRESTSYGIGTIGMFIGEERDIKNAKYIYPHLIFLEETTNLPHVIAKTLKIVIANPA